MDGKYQDDGTRQRELTTSAQVPAGATQLTEPFAVANGSHHSPQV
jgi:hypothetical protein